MRKFVVATVLVVAGVGVAAPGAERSLPPIAQGVKVGGVKVGGLGSERARTRLDHLFAKRLQFSVAGKRFSVSPRRLGARAAVDDAVTRALKAAPGSHVALKVRVNRRAVRRYVDRLAKKAYRAPQDAKLLGLARLRPSIRQAVPGRVLDRRATTRAIAWELRSGSRNPLRLPLRAVPAKVTLATYGPVIVIRRYANRLYLYDGQKLVRIFSVATGQAAYPSPTGWWTIVVMERNPWWRPPDSPWARGLSPIPPGPGNPLGTRWMGLSASGVGIHGTPDAASIGYSASHGCIRMRIPDAEWLFTHVHIGTSVFIVSA